LPTITGSLNGCSGTNVTLTGSGPAGSPSWSSSATTIASVSTLGVVSAISAGTSNITYRNSNNCTVTKAFAVNASPVAPTVSSVSITTPQIVTLTASGCSGGTVTWYNSAGANVGTGLNYVTPTAISTSTTYTADCSLNSCVSFTRSIANITFTNCPGNILHTSTITSGSYQAVNTINSTVAVPSLTYYKAGNSITLEPGFKADAGTVFEAKIAGCN
jgi:Ig-like domain CHU_C associated